MEERSPVPLSRRDAIEAWKGMANASRLEVVSRSPLRTVTEYSLLVDSKAIGEFEWIGGRHPELHLQAEDRSGFVRLKRLRPFILVGSLEAPGSGGVAILHVGSAGQGLVEVGGVQFLRRTPPTGAPCVRNHEGKVVLMSVGASGKRILGYDRASSNLELPELLELTLVEAFCLIYPARYMFRSLLTAWARIPRMGVPLGSHPRLKMLRPGSE